MLKYEIVFWLFVGYLQFQELWRHLHQLPLTYPRRKRARKEKVRKGRSIYIPPPLLTRFEIRFVCQECQTRVFKRSFDFPGLISCAACCGTNFSLRLTLLLRKSLIYISPVLLSSEIFWQQSSKLRLYDTFINFYNFPSSQQKKVENCGRSWRKFDRTRTSAMLIETFQRQPVWVSYLLCGFRFLFSWSLLSSSESSLNKL